MAMLLLVELRISEDKVGEMMGFSDVVKALSDYSSSMIPMNKHSATATDQNGENERLKVGSHLCSNISCKWPSSPFRRDELMLARI
jgi:hypothetical protein